MMITTRFPVPSGTPSDFTLLLHPHGWPALPQGGYDVCYRTVLEKHDMIHTATISMTIMDYHNAVDQQFSDGLYQLFDRFEQVHDLLNRQDAPELNLGVARDDRFLKETVYDSSTAMLTAVIGRQIQYYQTEWNHSEASRQALIDDLEEVPSLLAPAYQSAEEWLAFLNQHPTLEDVRDSFSKVYYSEEAPSHCPAISLEQMETMEANIQAWTALFWDRLLFASNLTMLSCAEDKALQAKGTITVSYGPEILESPDGNHVEKYILGDSIAGLDVQHWNQHETFAVMVYQGLTIRWDTALTGRFTPLSPIEEILSGTQMQEILHGLGHTVLDHPTDHCDYHEDHPLYLPIFSWPEDRGRDMCGWKFDPAYIHTHPSLSCGSVFGFVSCPYGTQITAMPMDIVALQSRYGRSDHEAGDTRYIINALGALPDPLHHDHTIMTIWDAGGFNTIDASAYEGEVLNLGLSAEAMQVSYTGTMEGSKKAFMLGFGTEIHQVITGRAQQVWIATDPNISQELHLHGCSTFVNLEGSGHSLYLYPAMKQLTLGHYTPTHNVSVVDESGKAYPISQLLEEIVECQQSVPLTSTLWVTLMDESQFLEPVVFG